MLHNRRREDRLTSPSPNHQPRKAQVIEISQAITSKISLRWSPEIKRRIYRDFLRGVDPIDLRVSYRDPVFGLPKVYQIVDVIRAEAREQRDQANRQRYIEFPRRPLAA